MDSTISDRASSFVYRTLKKKEKKWIVPFWVDSSSLVELGRVGFATNGAASPSLDEEL